MSRTAIRTRYLVIDDVNRILTLFGTIKNAHRQLGLDGLLDYTGVFYRAMHLQPIKPEEWDLITSSWSRWQELFLRPEVPASDPLAITAANRESDPLWFPGKYDDRDD